MTDKITRIQANAEARQLMATAASGGQELKLNQALHGVAKSHGYANLQHMKRHYSSNAEIASTATAPAVRIGSMTKTPDGWDLNLAPPAKGIINLSELLRDAAKINPGMVMYSDPAKGKSTSVLKPFDRKEPVLEKSVPAPLDLAAIFAAFNLDQSSDFTKDDWLDDANAGETDLGYWDWVVLKYTSYGCQSPDSDNDRGVWEYDLEAGTTTKDYWAWLADRHATPPAREFIHGTAIVAMKLSKPESLSPSTSDETTEAADLASPTLR